MRQKLLKYVLVAFTIFSLLTLCTLWFFEKEESTRKPMTFHDAFLTTLMLFGAGEPLNLDIHNLNWFTGLLVVTQTILGLATLTICFSLLADFLMSERISKLMDREKINFTDHIILCGLGNIGFRVLEELQHLKQKVVVIDRGDEKDYIELAKREGHKVILDNLKVENSLILAGIEKAKSIIICTNNDLLNMEVALNARRIRDDIIIVMRMFDQTLAGKVADAFKIKVAFSPATLAAPVFAAASFDRSVFQSVKIERELFVSARFNIEEDSKLIGISLEELLAKDLVILKLISGEERLKFPGGKRKFQKGDRLYITCSMETLEELKPLVRQVNIEINSL